MPVKSGVLKGNRNILEMLNYNVNDIESDSILHCSMPVKYWVLKCNRINSEIIN